MRIFFFVLFSASAPFLSIIPPLICCAPRIKRKEAIGLGFRTSIIALIAMLLLGLTLFPFGVLAYIFIVGWLTHCAAQKAGAEKSFEAMLASVGISVVCLSIMIDFLASSI